MHAKTLTTFLDIKMGQKEALQCLLKQIANPMKTDNPVLRFSPKTHFARLVVLPGTETDIVYAGEEPLRETRGDVCDPKEIDPRRWRLMLNAVYDGETDEFIRDMVTLSPDVDAIFTHCEGYPGKAGMVDYLTSGKHARASQIFYDTFPGETVESINAKAQLRDDIQAKLDKHPDDFQAALTDVLTLTPIDTEIVDLGPAATRALVLYALALIAALAVIFVGAFMLSATVGWSLVALFVLFVAWVLGPALYVLFAKRDLSVYSGVLDQVAQINTPDQYQASALTGREDVMVQNQFNLYLTFEGNWLVRNIRMIRQFVLMVVLGQTTHIGAVPGSLAGLTTVHFGSWVLIDGGRRLFFITNYDGSWENYIADFVNKIYHLLDVQLLLFKGFDREGTRNIVAFRRWLRRIQIQADVFYSGYPLISVRNTIRDIKINQHFKALKANPNDSAAQTALMNLLASPPVRTQNERKPDDREVLAPTLTRAEWDDIQAFVVYGYARLPYGRYVFLTVEDAAAAKTWLTSVIPYITTVSQWDADEIPATLTYALNLSLTHAGMQALGLPQMALDTFPREFQEGIAPPPKGEQNQKDYLHPRSIILGDTGSSAPYHWTVGNPNHKPIHLVLMLSGRNAAEIDAVMASAPFDALLDGTAGVSVLSTQSGFMPATGREAFGWMDGVSNPFIEGTRYNLRRADGSKGDPLGLHDPQIVKEQGDGLPDRVIPIANDPVVRTGEFILGYPNEYGLLPATPLLKDDDDVLLRHVNGKDSERPGELNGYKDFGRNGSYVVYRKLKQDVEAFWGEIRRRARQTENGPDLHDMQRLGAKIFGRWPSGVSLVLSPERDNLQIRSQAVALKNVHLYNNFSYRMPEHDDTLGLRCPFGAHVRRAHPRDSLIDDHPRESMNNVNLHRIIRRGVSFGKLYDHQLDPEYFDTKIAPLTFSHDLAADYPEDTDGVGLHFFAVVANIAGQFEFVQQAWNNNPRFNGLYNSRDVIVGDNPELAERIEGVAPNRYAEIGVETVRQKPSNFVIPEEPVRQRLIDMPRFITVKGGAYLFMPGITALRYLVGQ